MIKALLFSLMAGAALGAGAVAQPSTGPDTHDVRLSDVFVLYDQYLAMPERTKSLVHIAYCPRLLASGEHVVARWRDARGSETESRAGRGECLTTLPSAETWRANPDTQWTAPRTGGTLDVRLSPGIPLSTEVDIWAIVQGADALRVASSEARSGTGAGFSLVPRGVNAVVFRFAPGSKPSGYGIINRTGRRLAFTQRGNSLYLRLDGRSVTDVSNGVLSRTPSSIEYVNDQTDRPD
jgi:hypothetical protein